MATVMLHADVSIVDGPSQISIQECNNIRLRCLVYTENMCSISAPLWHFSNKMAYHCGTPTINLLV